MCSAIGLQLVTGESPGVQNALCVAILWAETIQSSTFLKLTFIVVKRSRTHCEDKA